MKNHKICLIGFAPFQKNVAIFDHDCGNDHKGN